MKTVTAERPRVLIVEPHDPYRRALTELVSRNGFHAEETADLSQAPHAVASRQPAIVMLCVGDLGDAAHIKDLSERAPEAAIVAISFREDGELLIEALRAGAKAFLPKRAAPREILDALHRALTGEVVVHPSLVPSGLLWAAEILGSFRSEIDQDPLSRLSTREREVLGLLQHGLSAAAIGERLFLSRRTVEGHLTNSYRKLGVRNRIGAVQELIRAERLREDRERRLG